MIIVHVRVHSKSAHIQQDYVVDKVLPFLSVRIQQATSYN